MSDIKAEKLVIIGSGPAGLTAAIYAARAGLNPLVISGRATQAQITLATEVEDYPGFPDGITGAELLSKFKAQADRFEVRVVNEDVEKVDFTKQPLEIHTSQSSYLAQAVILATGASPAWLGLPSERKLVGRGVSVCAVCDGAFFRGKKVAVIGGGDSAMREAQHLAKLASSVVIIHRRDTFRAQDALQEMIKQKDNVSFLLNSTVEEILGEEKVTGLKVKNCQSGEESQIEIDGLFLAIGHKPNTAFLSEQVDLDSLGYIVVKNGTHTSVPGVFVAGDVGDSKYRQIITAAGAGCRAALDADEYLENTNSSN